VLLKVILRIRNTELNLLSTCKGLTILIDDSRVTEGDLVVDPEGDSDQNVALYSNLTPPAGVSMYNPAYSGQL
jgi:hypothetical protein